jgi:hypothetical protein
METNETDEPSVEANEEPVIGDNDGNGTNGDSEPSTGEGNKKRKRLPKGSVPPSLNLEEASDITNRIYELAGSEASYDVVSRITGNSTRSSTFLNKIITLKNYGLITDVNRTITLTESGRKIAGPRTPTERALALKQAFLNIGLYSTVYEKFKGRLLPPDEFLINTFADYVPTRELASAWMDSFKKSAKKAGLLELRQDGKIVVLETINPSHHAEFIEPELPPVEQKKEEVPASVVQPSRPPTGSEYSGNGIPRKPQYGHVSKISLSGNREAEFSIPDKLTSRDAQKLTKALEGLKTIIESMVDEEESGSGIAT